MKAKKKEARSEHVSGVVCGWQFEVPFLLHYCVVCCRCCHVGGQIPHHKKTTHRLGVLGLDY